MIVNIDDYRRKKSEKDSFIKIPVFKRIFVEGTKLVGEMENGKKVIIDERFMEEE